MPRDPGAQPAWRLGILLLGAGLALSGLACGDTTALPSGAANGGSTGGGSGGATGSGGVSGDGGSGVPVGGSGGVPGGGSGGVPGSGGVSGGGGVPGAGGVPGGGDDPASSLLWREGRFVGVWQTDLDTPDEVVRCGTEVIAQRQFRLLIQARSGGPGLVASDDAGCPWNVTVDVGMASLPAGQTCTDKSLVYTIQSCVLSSINGWTGTASCQMSAVPLNPNTAQPCARAFKGTVKKISTSW